MKKFTPKNASMTKKHIWSFFYEYQPGERKFMCYGELENGEGDGLVKKPAYNANQIPDKLCQRFVDQENALHDEGMDEEDLVDARDELVQDMHHLILAVLKKA